MKTCLLLSLLLFLSGCITTFKQPDIKLDSVESYINRSKVLIKQQHWSEAQQTLEQGLLQYPKSQIIRTTLENTEKEWKRRNSRLENWMLVYETEGLLLKRPLLIAMSESDPDNHRLKGRLSTLKSTLQANRALLMVCAEKQLNSNLRLAKRCTDAARVIHSSKEISKLNNIIAQKQSGISKREEQKAKVVNEKAQKDLIREAKTQLEAQAYHLAINILQPILLLNSEDIEANMLMDEAKAGRSLQVLRLTRLGDQFYRDENIEQALHTWESAAFLYPESTEIKTRIERAKKVLDKLKEIRSIN